MRQGVLLHFSYGKAGRKRVHSVSIPANVTEKHKIHMESG